MLLTSAIAFIAIIVDVIGYFGGYRLLFWHYLSPPLLSDPSIA
jgi:hypothetical protein